ncbi:hypothetical protein [Parapedobacter luteus]|uniref:hypothetical protein n=1 Tax=Parapedobacter luteus TaxID=623280 RepID=UPI0009A832A1|nr:hypothetical protein [Parapedobacter luteus]
MCDCLQALGKKPDNVIGAKQYENGVMEVVQYSGPANLHAANPNTIETYWLYFFDDRLVEWGKPLSDWEIYVTRIYETRCRTAP